MAPKRTTHYSVRMLRILPLFAVLLHCSESPFTAPSASMPRDAGSVPGPDAAVQPDSGADLGVCDNPDVSPTTCSCTAAVTSGAFKLPAHTSYARYAFGTSAFSKLEMEVRVVKDPGDQVGLYVAPFNGTIDGTLTYLGMQTNVTNNKLGTRTGKGIVFSRWASLDPEDTKIADGGFLEVGTHEGEFVGIRLNYPWSVGTYTLTLQRTTADLERDWFELSLVDAANKKTFIGALRFPRKVAGTPAAIAPATTLFTEVYMGATKFTEVPVWELEVRQRADGKPATKIASEYPAYPNMEKFPNTDVYYTRSSDTMRFTFGGTTDQCHSAGKLK
jgi:hypothetical protein